MINTLDFTVKMLECNSPENGLLIMSFDKINGKCILKCKHCGEENERVYHSRIFNSFGCNKCHSKSKIGTNMKHPIVGKNHRLFRIFNNMHQRTTNKANKAYMYYAWGDFAGQFT